MVALREGRCFRRLANQPRNGPARALRGARQAENERLKTRSAGVTETRQRAGFRVSVTKKGAVYRGFVSVRLTETREKLARRVAPSAVKTPDGADQRLLAGVDARAVCFGHTHVQFRRKGPRGIELINAGSVGMPWDGDQRAAWALYREGEFELRRTGYDIARAIAAARALGDEPLVRTYESASR